MENLDRIVTRPDTEKCPGGWFFKTSEGLMGPFESHETAKTMLDAFVAKCKASAGRQANESFCEIRSHRSLPSTGF